MNDASNGQAGVLAPVAATSGGEIRLMLFGRTDVGQIREHNEDNFLVADLTRKSRSLLESDRVMSIGQNGTILGVCDGMGGAAAGEVASQLAVDIIFEKMSSGGAARSRDEFAHRLVQAVETAGLRIFTEAKVDRARRGMGTTATIAGLIDGHLFLAQVGDSRGYVLRGDKLVQVTRDQSLVNQLIEAGQLTEAEAETFEHNNIILQALGTADTVQVDLTYVVLNRGDTLLLCSDGLSGMIRFDEIREVLTGVPDPFEACRVLVDRANRAGGHDNITVIVAKFEGDALPSATADADDLRYRKYPLSEDALTPADAMARAPSREPSERPVMGASSPPGTNAAGDRLSDHGPSRSKVTHTIVGGQMSQAALAAIAARTPEPPPPPAPANWKESPYGRGDHDPIFIPTSNAPAWMVGGVVLTALALALVAGYYLLR
ncbi:MAG TPA: PP2C family serine/threonine-protein phosphatase [Polyangiaceae bacterium]|nr:PP2C family serine/threonine-protein phosphatase [Polyangiaceae bacterium]